MASLIDDDDEEEDDDDLNMFRPATHASSNIKDAQTAWPAPRKKHRCPPLLPTALQTAEKEPTR